jgi:hypothetical protein
LLGECRRSCKKNGSEREPQTHGGNPRWTADRFSPETAAKARAEL